VIRILGIDPGSRITGYGIIDTDGRRNIYVGSGCVKVAENSIGEKIKTIFDEISTLVATEKPAELAIEKVFMHRNADSALKLGQARGAAICAVTAHSLPVFEYTPAQIKQSVVGKGNAEKRQVQHMVKFLLNLPAMPQADAADALAAALCHANTKNTLAHMHGVRGMRGGRFR
jgi:crossover junction endodeoxyribonuclease RuvC